MSNSNFTIVTGRKKWRDFPKGDYPLHTCKGLVGRHVIQVEGAWFCLDLLDLFGSAVWICLDLGGSIRICWDLSGYVNMVKSDFRTSFKHIEDTQHEARTSKNTVEKPSTHTNNKVENR